MSALVSVRRSGAIADTVTVDGESGLVRLMLRDLALHPSRITYTLPSAAVARWMGLVHVHEDMWRCNSSVDLIVIVEVPS